VFDTPNPEKYDLVYIDTPYFSTLNLTGVDYRDFYHFLEGIANYNEWNKMIDWKSKHLVFKKIHSVWTDKNQIYDAFYKLFNKFQKSILVVSYRSDGIPTQEEMIELLKKYKSNVTVKKKKYKYALSGNKGNYELLFIATD